MIGWAPGPNCRLEVSLAPGVALERRDGTLVAREGRGAYVLPPAEPSVREVVRSLSSGRAPAHRLYADAGAAGAAPLSLLLQVLAENRLLEIGVFEGGHALAILRPTSSYFELRDAAIDPEARYTLSRFAHVRCGAGTLVLHSPTATASVELAGAECLEVLFRLRGPALPGELAGGDSIDRENRLAILSLLLASGLVERAGNEPRNLRQWDFHDLLFHSSSRAGRQPEPLGATYRFAGKIVPPPPAKQYPNYPRLPLPKPDLARVAREDVTLTAALEGRRSVRSRGVVPPSLAELGEFLYRVARVRGQFDANGMICTSRPYPGGGACHELELYPVVDRCSGLAPGLYHYDALHHALAFLSVPNPQATQLLHDAWVGCAKLCWPDVLFVISARFGRLSWKYQSIAYATILKDVGVLYQTMYLVATAMRLGPCALGCGNADLLARAIGADYYEETSVGEFMLNGRS